MSKLKLVAKTREIIGKKVKDLRSQEKIPAVLYGHKIKPLNLTIDYSVFEKIYKEAGESTLIDLVVDDKEPVKVLIQDYQLHPRTNQFIHADLKQINMDEKLNTDIILEFTGEAPAVKDFSGILVTNMDHVEVECLPKDLVHEIKVDLSSLKNFEDSIHVSDINVPEGITILNAPEDVIALVQPPRTEKELEELETPAEETKPEGEEGEGEDKSAEGEGEDKSEENKS